MMMWNRMEGMVLYAGGELTREQFGQIKRELAG